MQCISYDIVIKTVDEVSNALLMMDCHLLISIRGADCVIQSAVYDATRLPFVLQ